MKKHGLFLWMAVFALLVLSASSGTAAVLGDADGNGEVGIGDAARLLQVLAVSGIADPNMLSRADADGNGRLGLEDVVYVLQAVSGLSEPRTVLLPVADTGSERYAVPGDLVILDAARYVDYEAEGLTYIWSQTGGTPVELSDTTASALYFDAPVPDGETEDLEFSLKITNADGRSTTTTVPVHLALTLPSPPLSAFARIDQAVENGYLTAEQDLVYRMFAAFGDSRLPEAYRGTTGDLDPTGTLMEARQKYDTLSVEAKTAIYPFLLPPYVDGSWYQLDSAGHRALHARRTPMADAPAAPVWKSVGNSKVRVWYEDGVVISKGGVNTQTSVLADGILLAVTDKIWPMLQGLMDTEPLPDGNVTPAPLPSPDYGAIPGKFDPNEALDIILARGMNASGYTFAYHEPPTPAFITIDCNQWPLGDDNTPGLVQIVTHELMHAWQYRYTMTEGEMSYRWLMEATAVWAESYVYPDANSENRYVQPFLDTSYLSIDAMKGSLIRFREYGAYLPFSFWTNGGKAPAEMVKNTWKNAATMDSLRAVDRSYPPPYLDGYPRQFTAMFERYWADAMAAVWNRGADGFFFKKDKLDQGAKALSDTPVRVSLGGNLDKVYYLKDLDLFRTIELPCLSARFYHFIFTDNAVRTVVFYDGMRSNLKLMDSNDGTRVYVPEPLPIDPVMPLNDPAEGAHWGLITKIGGRWKVWTSPLPGVNTGTAAFCRDAKAERLQELVVLLVNSSPDETKLIKPIGFSPALLVSNIASWGWEGTVNATREGTPGSEPREAIHATVSFRRGQDVYPSKFPAGATPPGIFVLKSGSFSWEITGSYGDCAIEGRDSWSWSTPMGSVPFEGPEGAIAMVPEARSGTMYRKFTGDGDAGSHTCTYTVTCPNQEPTVVETVPVWWVSKVNDTLPNISALGERIIGNVTVDGTRYDWSLTAVREP